MKKNSKLKTAGKIGYMAMIPVIYIAVVLFRATMLPILGLLAGIAVAVTVLLLFIWVYTA